LGGRPSKGVAASTRRIVRRRDGATADRRAAAARLWSAKPLPRAMDFSHLLAFTVSPWELMLRGTLLYWFLFLIFRFVLRRDANAIGLTDFLFIVLIGDAAQNGMIGEATSSADSMLLITTLVAWNVGLDFLACRSKRFERFAMGRRLCLLKNGQLNRHAMRREFITADELKERVHQQGAKDFEDIELIYLEPSGEVTVIPKKPAS
jgi:uncharacterized membrane protein YcaP (DUF421 family)